MEKNVNILQNRISKYCRYYIASKRLLHHNQAGRDSNLRHDAISTNIAIDAIRVGLCRLINLSIRVLGFIPNINPNSQGLLDVRFQELERWFRLKTVRFERGNNSRSI